jgi:hypothetical protein
MPLLAIEAPALYVLTYLLAANEDGCPKRADA